MKKIVSLIIMGTVFASFAVSTAAAEEYEVQKGDNLWNIAEEHNTSFEELMDINGLSSTIIQPNQIIIIDNTYIVKQNDTLMGIAKEFDVTVKEIKKWNELDSDLLVIGQELTIKGQAANKNNKVDNSNAKATTTKEPAAKETKEAAPVAKKETTSAPEGKTISVSATAYTAQCQGCSGITATGVNLNNDPNAKVIAVDPSVIPLGTKVHVEGYGNAIAADTGGAIKGSKIDIHVPTRNEALNWGVRTVKVTILN